VLSLYIFLEQKQEVRLSHYKDTNPGCLG